MALFGSQAIVVALGAIVFVLSAWGIYSPVSLVKLVRHVMEQSYGMHVAVIVRLVLGAALVIAAPISQFPTTFLILGWITIAAAVGLVLVGRERIRAVIAWFEQLSTSAIRLWLTLGMAFAAFLIYGVL